jgi:hypothetical protein
MLTRQPDGRATRSIPAIFFSHKAEEQPTTYLLLLYPQETYTTERFCMSARDERTRRRTSSD